MKNVDVLPGKVSLLTMGSHRCCSCSSFNIGDLVFIKKSMWIGWPALHTIRNGEKTVSYAEYVDGAYIVSEVYHAKDLRYEEDVWFDDATQEAILKKHSSEIKILELIANMFEFNFSCSHFDRHIIELLDPVTRAYSWLMWEEFEKSRIECL